MKLDKELVELLLVLISESSGVDASVIMSSSRLTKATVCRFLLFFYLREEKQWSLIRIGKALGRDHVTVMHGLNRVKDFLTLPSYGMERKLHDDFTERIMIHENEN